MATKKFPSEMSSRGTVLGTDKILIYNATTGASDEVCTVAELLKMLTDIYPLSGLTTGKVPYKSATVLENSPIFTNGTNIDIGLSEAISLLSVNGANRIIGDWGLVTFKTTDAFGIDNGASIVLGGKYNTAGRFLDFGAIAARKETAVDGNSASYLQFGTITSGGTSATEKVRITSDGNVVIGATTGSYKLTLASDSAGKPGAGGLWTVVSDARIKKDIELADLDICYNTIKNIPLKRYAWADGVYSEGQVPDRHNLGWIAQDVQKYFSKAVTVKPFTKNEKIEDGIEEYQEQDFVMEDKEVSTIEIINGNPVQVTKTVQEKVLLFDEVEVKDELGNVVLENGKPILYQVPRMITKTRPKFRQEVIEDCLDLNSGQLYAAMFGALQKAMQKIESLEQEVALLKQ